MWLLVQITCVAAWHKLALHLVLTFAMSLLFKIYSTSGSQTVKYVLRTYIGNKWTQSIFKSVHSLTRGYIGHTWCKVQNDNKWIAAESNYDISVCHQVFSVLLLLPLHPVCFHALCDAYPVGTSLPINVMMGHFFWINCHWHGGIYGFGMWLGHHIGAVHDNVDNTTNALTARFQPRSYTIY